MNTGVGRKSYFKGKNMENGSIKNNVFEKNIRPVFCVVVEQVNCLTDYCFLRAVFRVEFEVFTCLSM